MVGNRDLIGGDAGGSSVAAPAARPVKVSPTGTPNALVPGTAASPSVGIIPPGVAIWASRIAPVFWFRIRTVVVVESTGTNPDCSAYNPIAVAQFPQLLPHSTWRSPIATCANR